MTLADRWRAAPRDVRWFQAVFTFLTLNFLLPSVGYLAAPELAMESFREIGAWLGAPAYPVAEESIVWRTLAATNVATLGVMCLLLQWDVVRYHPVLLPLVFLKGSTALVFLGQYALVLSYPGFLAVFFWDALAVALILGLVPRARRSLLASSVAGRAGANAMAAAPAEGRV